METIIITTQDNNTYKFTPAIKNASGDFSPCGFNDSIFAEGSTCKVFLALGEDKRRYLIKQYKPGFTGDESYETITNIMRRYNKQGDNYILGDVYTGVGCFENSKEKERLNYKVFKYREGSVLLPYEGRESIFTNTKMVYSTLLDFLSLLNTLKLLHAEIDGEAYLHCDIKLDNTFSLNINNKRVVQLIDMDSVRSKRDLVEAIENDVPYDQLIPTTAKYYSNDDVKVLCELRGEELQRCVYILDTTAAIKMLSEMLVGNIDYNTSKDDEVLKKNEALQNALYNFFKKGLWNDFPERFSNVDEMIQQLSAVVAALSDSLPTTILTEKLKALTQNREINKMRDNYRNRHKLNEASRKEIFVYELLNDIDPVILPNIQKEGQLEPIQGNSTESAVEMLLRDNSNFFIIGGGGQGKTTSLQFAWLRNIQNIEDNCLYVYIPLACYSQHINILDFIADQSGCSIDLINNMNNRIVLLLDGFDEYAEYREATEKKKVELLSEFNAQISSLIKTGYQIIITSRFDPGWDMPEFIKAEFLPLDDTQIEAGLSCDNNEVRQRHSTILHNMRSPFFVSIYRSLRLKEKNLQHIVTTVDLMDEFFRSLFQSKNTAGNNMSDFMREVFDGSMKFVSEAAFDQSWYRNAFLDGFPKFDLQLRELILSCYRPIIHLHEKETGWRIDFSHQLFKEYFEAKHLTQKLKGLFQKGHFSSRDIEEIFFWDHSCSTLFFVSIMLKSKTTVLDDPKRNFEQLFQYVFDKSNKSNFDKQRVDLDELFQQVFEPDETSNNESDNFVVIEEGSPLSILFRGDGRIILLRLIAFLFIDLSNFDFGENFSDYILPSETFCECHELTRIVFPSHMHGIQAAAFKNCKNLSDIELPKTISPSAGGSNRTFELFLGCSSLRKVRIPHGVTSLGYYIFKDCMKLEIVYLPDTITQIGQGAFENCCKLKQLLFEGTKEQWRKIEKTGSWRYKANVFEIHCLDGTYTEEHFAESGLEVFESETGVVISSVGYCTEKNVTIPSYAVNIGEAAFIGCCDIESVLINVSTIEKSAFSNCKNLTKLSMNVETIGSGAFDNCNKLTTICIGPRLQQVHEYAFWHHTRGSITKIFYDGGLEEWLHIYFANDASNPCCEQGLLHFKESCVIDICPNKNCSEILPYAFSGCISLKKVSLGKHIKSIGAGAFQGCSNLSTIIFHGSVAEWDRIAKNEGSWYELSGINCVICEDGIVKIPNPYCDALVYELSPDSSSYYVVATNSKEPVRTIIIPSHYYGKPVVKICKHAFQNTRVDQLYIPDSIQVIDEEVSFDMSLPDVHFHGSIESWHNISKRNDFKDDENWTSNLVLCFDGLADWVLPI